jgi:hypothetical protein
MQYLKTSFVKGNEGSDSIAMRAINEMIAKTVVLRNRESKSTYTRGSLGKKLIIVLIFILAVLCTISFFVSTKSTQQSDVKPTDTMMVIIPREKNMRIGSKPLKTPVEKVILVETKVAAGEIHLKGNFYPFYEDIKENFVISTDGKIYEGRGFLREGQVARDKFGTSYDDNAISKESNSITFTKFS